MKGYYTYSGYKGYIPSMGYILFCTKSEYEEYFYAHCNDINDNEIGGNFDE